VRVLKRDSFGRVELLEHGGERAVRRVACGGALPLSTWIAGRLLARERRALAALAGLAGVPSQRHEPEWVRAADAEGQVPSKTHVLVRGYLPGSALHQAEALPADFFEHLDCLVGELHARGVCHNDLHKEQNVVVGPDGRPGLIDFQLASVHPRAGPIFRSRCRDDLRHVDKHRRRYLRAGRGPADAVSISSARPPRSALAAVWRRLVKPLYNAVVRTFPRARDGEERRPSSGPWPRWNPPLGPPGSGSG
jgi:Phosphotransferase enzyme family